MKNKNKILILSAILFGSFANAKEVIKMTGADSAVAVYDDKCSNGANITKSGRKAFTDAMLKNPNSKLSKLKRELLKNTDPDMPDTFICQSGFKRLHLRDGCSTSVNFYTAFVQTEESNNTNLLTTHYLITIEDSEESGDRKLNVVSIKKADL